MKKAFAASTCALFASLAVCGASAQNVKPFRIGVLNDQSSVYSTIGGKGAQLAVEMAVADFGGKVLGRPIEVLSADHQNKVDVATGIAREWMESKDVQAIFDLQNSAVALAVIPLVQKANRIAIVSGGASSEITGKACTPVSFHWTYDTYSLSRVLPRALIASGKKNWYLIDSDYAAGAALERDVAGAVEQFGGKVVGKVKVPLGATNFASTMLAAQGSKADVIMLGGAGADLINQVKQAREFGISEQQVLATPYANIIDVHALGLAAAQGLYVSEPFYWDLNDETRAWSKRFIAKMGVPATSFQAGNYSAALHYLKAVAAAGTSDGLKVADAMRRMPINDMMTKNGQIRADGRVVRDLYLFQVKSPAKSKYKFDYYETRATVAGADAFRPLAESECPLVKR
ncbi:ABC transporter substrate-binding protein [Rhodoferax sediminis]|uniref:ABC transporter substrate-binding protein n=1 Tax=Rhodoferax sediminis TaxID=2509614 RepID=A0A515DDW8_9BURK|nr:ABC transporter substrate-binding protein [Rhodoferax sediminis]QDL38618.1 ABC transporter substrate-binding protein [Rhodoferax sediminis]